MGFHLLVGANGLDAFHRRRLQNLIHGEPRRDRRPRNARQRDTSLTKRIGILAADEHGEHLFPIPRPHRFHVARRQGIPR